MKLKTNPNEAIVSPKQMRDNHIKDAQANEIKNGDNGNSCAQRIA